MACKHAGLATHARMQLPPSLLQRLVCSCANSWSHPFSASCACTAPQEPHTPSCTCRPLMPTPSPTPVQSLRPAPFQPLALALPLRKHPPCPPAIL
eukprot:scaffold102102_cov22-Tisochrysis_lutea.AAC.1